MWHLSREISESLWEWVQDWYAKDYYKQRPNPDTDPQGPEEGDSRVLRGGGYLDELWGARCVARDCHEPDVRDDINGFRVVLRP